MKTIAPLYHVPGRKSITKYIDNKYDVLAPIMKNYLRQVDHFTLTTDIWTETMNTKSFLSLTCHFFLTDSLHSVTIGVTELNDRHTAEYIADSLRKLCVEWNIPLSRVTAIVTDNGKNMVKAVSDLLGKNFHLPCFAHTLDLVASNIVDTEDVKQILDKIKCIVTYFKQSVVAADELRKAQGVESLKLIQSVPTRWNSTLYMIERFLKLCSFVAPILLKFPKSPPMIDASELEVVKEIITVLAPIEAVSKEICGEKYLTCSKVIPIINCLSQNLKKLSPSTEYGKKFLTRTLNEVQKRFGAIEQNKILAISCILDPRFKKLHFNNVNACAQAINSINSYSNIVNEEQGQAAGHVQMKSTSDLEGGFSLWSFHQELALSSLTEKKSEGDSNLCLELKMYLSQPVVDMNTDVITFWNQKPNDSILRKLAFQYLSVVATSVPSERLCSKAGNIMIESRNRLLGKRLSKLLFLNSLPLEKWEL